MYNSIRSNEDVKYFLEKTNSLHDGYIIGVQYVNDGISNKDYGRSFDAEQTKLILKILITSIGDAVAELEFDNLLEWQIKDSQWEITDTTVTFDDQGWISWADDVYANMDELKNGSYAIARSMKWRITE